MVSCLAVVLFVVVVFVVDDGDVDVGGVVLFCDLEAHPKVLRCGDDESSDLCRESFWDKPLVKVQVADLTSHRGRFLLAISEFHIPLFS